MDKLRISTFGRSAPHQAALSHGYYAAEDLEVELDVTAASKTQAQQLMDGVWDMVHSNADNIYWWNEDNGADFLIVLAIPGQPNMDLVVRPEIQSYQDLRGKPIAVDAAESGYVTPLRLLLKQAGLEIDRDYTFVQVGAGGQRQEALRKGTAVGAMVGVGGDQGLLAEGFRVLDSINRLYSNYAGAGATRRAWAQENSDLLVRYLRAHIRGLLDERGGKPPPFGWEGLREMMELRKEVGLLRGAADPHRFADDTYYLRAIEGLGG